MTIAQSREMPRLRLLRERVGLKQAEVARRMGVAEALISRWEHQMRPVPTYRFKALAEALECERGDLFDAPRPADPGAAPPSGRLNRKLQDLVDWDRALTDEALPKRPDDDDLPIDPLEPEPLPPAARAMQAYVPRGTLLYQSGTMGRSPICARCSAWDCRRTHP